MSVFLDIPKEQWILETDYFFVIKDKYPVTEGHLLIISKRKADDYFALNEKEQSELLTAINVSKQYLNDTYGETDYNIGMNCGEYAGQTVFHFHCHIIPRRKGDVEDPRGGVRHSVIGKGYY
jgi:diadenosine tetraphosphate (Ap4A) HIT family hydrolase